MEKLKVVSTEENIRGIAEAIGMEVDDSIVKEAVKMTEEDINSVCNVLRDQRNPELEERMEFDSEAYAEYMQDFQAEDKSLEQGIGTIAVNPANGAGLVVETQELSTEPTEDVDLVALFNNEKHEITLDQCKDVFVTTYGLDNEEDQQVLFNALMDTDNAVFDNLPTVIKSAVTMAIPAKYKNDTNTINKFTKFILNDIKSDIMVNKATIDMNNVISNTMGEMGKVMDEVLEYNREIFEKKLTEQANDLEQQGHTIKAKQLRKCAESFRNSYTYDCLYRTWNSLRVNGKKVTIKKYLDSELKFYHQHTQRFNNRYKTIQLNINSSALMLPTLRRVLPLEKEDNLKKFVILFCMYSALLTPSKWEDHIFMYYTIQNIVALDAIKDKESGLAKEIIDNIKRIIDTVIK